MSDGHNQHVLPLVVFHRGEYAHRQGGQQNKHHGDDTHLAGDGEAAFDDVVHRLAGIFVGGPEIKPEQAFHVVEQLEGQGVVQAEFFVERGLYLGGGLPVAGEGPAGHRVHQAEGDDDDGQHGDQHHDQAFGNIFDHLGGLLRGYLL